MSKHSTFSARDSWLPSDDTKTNSLYIKLGPVNRNRISYFYDDDVSGIHYGREHPMKPQRITLANELVLSYGLHERLEMFQPRWATEEELKSFHVSDYIDFLRHVTPDNKNQLKNHIERFNVGSDCPIFNDLYKFCRISSGASIEAARRINNGLSDISINWAGGLHHAKRTEASGFCYVNDIVLGILELLRCHQRILYVDIDVHHGDGVQEAFFKTDRVMTVSFHRYGLSSEGYEFFPGTGSADEIGFGAGKYYAVNVPLKAGMDDASYTSLFQSVVNKVMEVYRPGAIVLQCGADSLGCDRLGCFCLSIKGHGMCVAHMKRFDVPMVVLGGGGYTVRNVARCWAYETALLVNADLPNIIPNHIFSAFYSPDYTLFTKLQDGQRNENTAEELVALRNSIFEQLRHIEHAPSVQMCEIPPSIAGLTDDGWAAEQERLLEMQDTLSARIRNGIQVNTGQTGTTYTEKDFYQDEIDNDAPEHDFELEALGNKESSSSEKSSFGFSLPLNGF